MKHLRRLAAIALILSPLAAQAQEVSLADLSAYLNSLTTAEARFVQTNADGTTATGRLILQRPYRARFEYDPPDQNLVLASGRMVAIFDAKSNQPPEQYPLARTPLNLILGPKIDLGSSAMVASHGEVAGMTHVLAQDPKHPDYGTIELVFSPAPVALTQWIITDDMGGQTAVTLSPMLTGGTYPNSLFSIEAETNRRGVQN
jgi:outer membrane lipoprotein-sorting protein